MRQLDIEGVHKHLLDIAKEFHRICVSNSIPYYMIGGTMLGAVRHQGFIPWDDDMDFGVPRPYFEKLQQILSDELQRPYSLVTRFNSFYPIGFIKIQDTRTLAIESVVSHRKDAYIGINIDIFPLEECSMPTPKLESLISTRDRIGNVINCIFRNLSGTLARRLTNRAFRLLFSTSHDNMIKWLSRQDEICAKINKTGSDAMANVYGFCGVREVISKKIWGTPTLYKFEDTELFGCCDYDRFLTQIYRDYMQLPPEEKRHIHLQNMYSKE